MDNKMIDRYELALKIAFSFAALCLFILLGWGALYLTPPPVDNPITRRSYADADRSKDNIQTENDFPLPPDSSEIHEEETEHGVIYIYESRLTPQGIRQFYTREFRKRGWETVASPQKTREWDEYSVLENTMHFTEGSGLCIINIEEKDSYKTHVTLIQSTVSHR